MTWGPAGKEEEMREEVKALVSIYENLSEERSQMIRDLRPEGKGTADYKQRQSRIRRIGKRMDQIWNTLNNEYRYQIH